MHNCPTGHSFHISAERRAAPPIITRHALLTYRNPGRLVRRPSDMQATRHTGPMTSDRAALDRPLRTGARGRRPALWAASALLVATAGACGSDSSDDDSTASDPTSSTPTSASASPTGSTSESPTASGSTTESGDPVSSPVIDKAVKDAL